MKGNTLAIVRKELKSHLEKASKVLKKTSPASALNAEIDASNVDQFKILELFVDAKKPTHLKKQMERLS